MSFSKFRLQTDGDKIVLNPILAKESLNLAINVDSGENKTKIRTSSFKNFDYFFNQLNADILSIKTTEQNVNKIFRAFEQLIQNYDNLIKQTIPAEMSEKCSSALDAARNFVLEKIVSRNTAKKRQKIIENDGLYVKPMKSAVGTTWKTKTSCGSDLPSHELKQTTGEFVSVIAMLESFFGDDEFHKSYFDYNETRKHKCTEGVFEDFCCGSIFKGNPIFDRTTIQLQLSFDDFEPCNALKTKAGTHKMLGIYLEIRNIDPKYKSKLANIHLVGLVKSHDMKYGGDFDTVANKIVGELKALETTGLTLKSGKNLKAVLVGISADNLGANSLCGFVESFSATYYCRICELSLKECQKAVTENRDRMRQKSDYEITLKSIAENEDSKPNYKETKGVKKACAFNKLNHFHIFDNCIVDIMHEINEGVILFFIRIFFQYLIQNKILTIREIEDLVRDHNYGWIWKKYKPSPINIDKHNLNQNAMQSYCLMLNLPFIFIAYRSKLGSMWGAMEDLLKIMQILYSTRIQKSDVERLEILVKSHLTYLVKLGAKLIPKHHIMTHYANLILKIGPLIHSWMMRFESKHKEFTDMVRLTQNYKDLPLTLAKRHQASSVIKRSMAVNIQIQESKITYDVSKYTNFEDLKTILNPLISENKKIKGHQFICYGSLEYRPGFMLIDGNQVHEIVHIISHSEKYFVLCEEYIIVDFVSNLNSIELKKSDGVYKLFEFSEIKSQKSYDCIHFDGKKFIIAETLDVYDKF